MKIGIDEEHGLEGISLEELTNTTNPVPDIIKYEESNFTNSEFQYTEKQLEIIKSIRESDEYKERDNLTSSEKLDMRAYNIQIIQKIKKLVKDQPVASRLLNTPEKQEIEFQKCQWSLEYFATNYISFATGGRRVPFKMNDKIRTTFLLAEASIFTMLLWERQRGKSATANIIAAWLLNFHQNTNHTLLNLSVKSNKENLRAVGDMLDQLPLFLKGFRPGEEDNIDNVFEKISGIGSRLSSVVVGDQPETVGRGSVTSWSLDEVSFIKDIEVAFAALSFAYSAYGRISKEIMSPAPFLLLSTPNNLGLDEGLWYWNLYQAGYKVQYEEIANLMPWEIQEYFAAEGIQTVSIGSNWYEDKLPVDKEYLIDNTDPRNQLNLLQDPNTSLIEIYEIDNGLGAWMSTQRQLCLNNFAKIKREIYNTPPMSISNAIFDEDTINALQGLKQNYNFEINLDGTFHGKLQFFVNKNMIAPHEKRYLLVVDPAYGATAQNDYCAFYICDVETKETIATSRSKTGKVKNIYKAIKTITNFFDNRIIVAIERNNFGVAVIEDCEDDIEIKSKLFHEYQTDKYGKRSFKEVNGQTIYGITTTKSNRPLMIEKLMRAVGDTPELLKSPDLVGEIVTLVEKNNKILAMEGSHDDLVMAFSIAHYIMEAHSDVIRMLTYSTEQTRINLATMSAYNSSEQDVTSQEFKRTITEIKHVYSDKFKNTYKDPMKGFKDDKKSLQKTNPHKLFTAMNG